MRRGAVRARRIDGRDVSRTFGATAATKKVRASRRGYLGRAARGVVDRRESRTGRGVSVGRGDSRAGRRMIRATESRFVDGIRCEYGEGLSVTVDFFVPVHAVFVFARGLEGRGDRRFYRSKAAYHRSLSQPLESSKAKISLITFFGSTSKLESASLWLVFVSFLVSVLELHAKNVQLRRPRSDLAHPIALLVRAERTHVIVMNGCDDWHDN